MDKSTEMVMTTRLILIYGDIMDGDDDDDDDQDGICDSHLVCQDTNNLFLLVNLAFVKPSSGWRRGLHCCALSGSCMVLV